MSQIKISAKAYCKIILHAAKYPYCAINGILLAKNSSIGSNEVEFVDAVPLFHVGINLTPMAEIALMQIDEIASANDLTIAGYYSAQEHLQDLSFEKAHNRIIEKITMNTSNAYVFLVNNMKLSNNMDKEVLKVAQYTKGNYVPFDLSRISVERKGDTFNVCSALLKEKAYDRLIDFDNHLDDVQLDWKNPQINKEVESRM